MKGDLSDQRLVATPQVSSGNVVLSTPAALSAVFVPAQQTVYTDSVRVRKACNKNVLRGRGNPKARSSWLYQMLG